MDPKQVDLIVLGLQEQDDLQFLENKAEFANQKFELDQQGDNYGINFLKFAKLLKNDILKNFNITRNKYSYYIYNNEKEKFTYINTYKLRLRNNFFYPITQKHIFDENKLVIKVQLQIKYSDYLENCLNINKIDATIQNIKFQNLSIERELEDEKNRLEEMREVQKQIADQNEISLSQQEKIDIALLYSHPLINDNQNVVGLPVSYKKEYEGLKDIKHKANKKIKYLITQANLNNLKFVLQADPQIIHIASHGEYDKDIQSSYLQFENQCKINSAYTYQLSQIIQQNCKSNLKLIFLNSCHSNEIAKKISQWSNTIAVTQTEQINDEVALKFALEFYNNLLLQEKDVKKCFEDAQKELLNKYQDDEKEIKKFRIQTKFGQVNFEPGKAKDIRQIILNEKEEFKEQEKLIPILYRELENQLNSLLHKRNTQIILILLKQQEQIQEQKAKKLVANAYQYFIQREPPLYVAAANEYQFPQKIKQINISAIGQFNEQFSSICIFGVTSQSFDEKYKEIFQIASKNLCVIITSEEITKEYDRIKFFTLRLDLLQ